MSSPGEGRCARHADVEAAGHCSRCGAAMCPACLALSDQCNGCARKARAFALPSARAATRVLRIVLWLNLGIALLGVGTFIELRAVAAGLAGPGVEELHMNGVNIELAALIPLQRALVPLLLFTASFWLNRMHRSIAWGRGFRFPAHAYLLLLVPIVNLVVPYFVLSELLRGGPQGRAPMGLLRLAWVVTVVASVALLLGSVAFRLGGSIPALMRTAEINLVAEVLFALALLLLLPVVSRIYARLELTTAEPKKSR